ncbi:MAG: RND transporter [Actinophytocola sp.]|nr:RND transporter [Actinophytocola sp.]
MTVRLLARLSGGRVTGRAVVGVTVLVALLAGIVAGIAQLTVHTGVDSFVPADDRVARATEEVAASFGGDPIVVLVESDKPHGQLSPDKLPKLLRLEGKLSGLPDVASVYGPATVLNQIAGQTQKLLAELTGYRDGLRAAAEQRAREQGRSPDEVRAEGRAAIADFDRRYAGLLKQGLPAGLPTLRNEKFVDTVVFGQGGEPKPQWHFVVPADDAVAILVRPRQGMDQQAVEQLTSSVERSVNAAELDANRVTVSGIPAVVSALGTQVRAEVPLLGGAALLAVGAWFLLVRWTKLRRRILPLVTTALGTAITLAAFGWAGMPVSLGVVAFLPVLLGVGSDFMTFLNQRLDTRVVATVAVATAASFAALAVTPIPVVAELGATLAVGIVISLCVGVVVARWLPPPVPAEPETASPRWPWARNMYPGPPWARRRCGRPAAAPLGHPPSRRVRFAAAGAAVLVAVSGWAMLPSLPLKADFQGFAADLPVLDDARHVERVMGSSGEIAISLSGEDTVTKETLNWMRSAQDAVVAAHGDQVHPVLSPPTLLRFLGGDPTADQLEAALRLVPRYLTTSVIRNDQGMSLLSFGVELNDAESLARLRDDIHRILPPPPEGTEVRITGLPMVAVSGYEAVSASRYLVAGLGILAAVLVLALGLRRRGDALRAGAAAVLATGLVLLVMRLTGIDLNPVTAAVGSLTAAVACEFTVVLAEAVRRRDAGIRRAVLLAAAASATGYAVLMLSQLAIIRAFGGLLAGTVGLSVLAAMFVVWLSSRPVPGDQVPDGHSRSDERTLAGAST